MVHGQQLHLLQVSTLLSCILVKPAAATEGSAPDSCVHQSRSLSRLFQMLLGAPLRAAAHTGSELKISTHTKHKLLVSKVSHTGLLWSVRPRISGPFCLFVLLTFQMSRYFQSSSSFDLQMVRINCRNHKHLLQLFRRV